MNDTQSAPDVVTTREQLAALPAGSVVRTDDGLIYERHLGWSWRGEQAAVPLPCRILAVGYPEPSA